MTTPDIKNSDVLLTQTNPAERMKKDLKIAGLLFLACVFVAFTKLGWSAVMLGLSVAPLETLATQLGVVIVPWFGGWVMATGLRLIVKKISFNIVWIWCVVFLSIGILNSPPQGISTSVATSRVASVPQASTDVTNAKTLNFYPASCEEAFNDGQWSTAFTACSKAANQGDRLAQLYLGALYEGGSNVDFVVAKNYAQAIHWYTMAAKQGLAEAQLQLGRVHKLGLGVVEDYARAGGWYRLAAEQGNTDGQRSLGSMYEDGLGVAQDYVRAHMWYNVAAANGSGKYNRDIVASMMTREQIAEAQRMARDCVAKNYKAC